MKVIDGGGGEQSGCRDEVERLKDLWILYGDEIKISKIRVEI